MSWTNVITIQHVMDVQTQVKITIYVQTNVIQLSEKHAAKPSGSRGLENVKVIKHRI